MADASDVLAGLIESDLLTTFNIQGYTVNGVHAVYQVVELNKTGRLPENDPGNIEKG